MTGYATRKGTTEGYVRVMEQKGPASNYLPGRSDRPCGQSRWESRPPELCTQLCFEIGQLLTFLFSPLLPLVEGEPASESFLNSDTRLILYSLSQLQGWLWGFLSCKGHVAAVCTFPAHKTSGLDPVVKPHALQNIPPHTNTNRSTAQRVYKLSPMLRVTGITATCWQMLDAGLWLRAPLPSCVWAERISRAFPFPKADSEGCPLNNLAVLWQKVKALRQQCVCRGYSWELKEQRCFCPAALMPS